MSESANPLSYVGGNVEKVVAFGDPSPLTREQLRSIEATPNLRVTTVVMEMDFGRANVITLDGRTLLTAWLPLAEDAGEACIADEIWDVPKCEQPFRTWINGWSAGPCPVCEEHAREIVAMQEDTGIWWRPVEVTIAQLDQLIAQDAI